MHSTKRDPREAPTSCVFPRGSFTGDNIFLDFATAVFTVSGEPAEASVVAEASRREAGKGTVTVFPAR